MRRFILIALGTLATLITTTAFADDVTPPSAQEINLARARAALPKVTIPVVDAERNVTPAPADEETTTAPVVSDAETKEPTTPGSDLRFIDVAASAQEGTRLIAETDQLISDARKVEATLAALPRDGASGKAVALHTEVQTHHRRISQNLDRLRRLMEQSRLRTEDASFDDGAAGVLGAMRTFQFQCAKAKRATSDVCVTAVKSMNQMIGARIDLMKTLFRNRVVRQQAEKAPEA